MDHVGHDHTHGEGHGHDHSHGLSDYYLEQLLTVLICGAMGLTAVLMYTSGRIKYILAPEFHPWVLGGGCALLVVTAIRAVTLWKSVGEPAQDHDHAGHEHDHAHGDAGHTHGPDCGHDHGPEDHARMPGGIYLKTIPFALPLVLFVMGLPNSGYSEEWVKRSLGQAEALGDVADVAAKGGEVLTLDFGELNAAAYDPGKRETYEGRTVRVKGQLQRISEREYTLFKLKMTCCVADTIPLKARIKSDIVIPAAQFQNQEWVTVEGKLQFVEPPGTRSYVPVIRIGGKGGLGMQKAQPE